MKKYSTVLILLGVLLIAYPLLDRAYTWTMQWQIEKTYGELDAVFTSEPENTADLEAAEPVQEASPQPPADTAPQVEPAPEAPAPETPPPAPAPVKKEPLKPVGIIKIGKINLKLPIMAGATAGNMKIGAGWMKQTTPLGEKGNTAIAAHRSQTRGRFFNRLDEMALGDQITIVKDGKELLYTVFNIVVVEPTDVSVLRGDKSESVITLITCTPIKTATHRLIVQAKMVP